MNSKKNKAKIAQNFKERKEGTEYGMKANNAKKSKLTKIAKKREG